MRYFTTVHLLLVVTTGLNLFSSIATSFSISDVLSSKFCRHHRCHRRRHCRRLASASTNNQRSAPQLPLSWSFTKLAVELSGGGEEEEDKSVVLSEYDDSADTSTTTTDADNNNALLLKGRTTLGVVALLYGTLNVSLRLVYQLPEPPTAAALSAARGILACAGFVPLLLWIAAAKKQKQQLSSQEQPVDSNNTETTTTTTTTATSLPPSSASTAPFLLLLWAGLELAVYNFLAQGLLNVGLLSTSSARASFLTQTSVVFTPVLTRLFGQSVPSNVWVACGLALVGLTVLSSAAPTAAAAMPAATAGGSQLLSSFVSFTTGDWLVLGGALSWSMYLFRLSKIAPKFDEINLQFVKSVLLAVLYVVWLVASVVLAGPIVGGGGGGGGTSLVASFITQPFGWLFSGAAFVAIFYSAVGPGTVADVLQQQGQKEVSASEANVILSLEPVFTALCAWVVLGELTSIREAVGGAIILAAALVATR